MRLTVYLLCCFGLAACNPQPPKEEQTVLLEKIDSLQKGVEEMSRRLELLHENADTVAQKAGTDSLIVPSEKTTPVEKPEVKKSPQQVANPVSDTTFHYYTNKKLSVKITPWKEGRRKLFFYDLKGAETFSLEDVRLSYSTTTQLKFHPNGAASKAEIHHNPGASRYWHETDITFDTDNQPLWKHERQMPVERIDIEESLPSFWNKEKKQWVKQEVVKETSTPGGE